MKGQPQSASSYHHRKWTQQPKFKSWTSLFVFHIVLKPLEIHLSFYQLSVNSQTDRNSEVWYSNLSRKKTSQTDTSLWKNLSSIISNWYELCKYTGKKRVYPFLFITQWLLSPVQGQVPARSLWNVIAIFAHNVTI